MRTKLKDLLAVIDIRTKLDVFYYSEGTIHDVDNISLKDGIPECLKEFEPLYVDNVKHKDGKIQIELEAPKKMRKSKLIELMRGVDGYHNLVLSYEGKDVATITYIDAGYAQENDAAEAVAEDFVLDYSEDYYVFENSMMKTPVAIELRFDFARLATASGREAKQC